MGKLSWAHGRMKEANEMAQIDMRLLRNDRGWIIYARGNTRTRARNAMRFLKLTDVIPPANFLARTITSGILSRYVSRRAFNATWKRGNHSRSPLQESAHQRAPTRPFAANYGEIAAKFVMCILLGDFAVPPRSVTRAYDYVWIASSPSFPPYVSFFLLIVESAGDYAVA